MAVLLLQVTCYQAQIRSLEVAFREINAAITAAITHKKPVYIRCVWWGCQVWWGAACACAPGVRTVKGGSCSACCPMPNWSICKPPSWARHPPVPFVPHLHLLPSPRSIPVNLASAVHPSFAPEPVPFSVPPPVSAKGKPAPDPWREAPPRCVLATLRRAL